MPSRTSGQAENREWIRLVRAQSDEADRRAADAKRLAGAAEAALLGADSFPGFGLEREIHRGAQGTVYRAVHKNTGRRVALKLHHEQAYGGPVERARNVLSGHEAQVVQVRFSHDGTLLLSYSWDGEAYLWDTRAYRPLLRFHLAYPAFSPDDRWVGGTSSEAGANRIKLFRLDAARERRRLVGSGDLEQRTEQHGVFVPGCDLLVLTHCTGPPESSGMRIFDLECGRELAHQMGLSLWYLSADPRGRGLLVSHGDSLCCWPVRPEDGRMTLGPPHRLCALSGQPAAGRAKRYSIARRCMHTAISPDGRWLAADGCRSAAAGVWDAQPGERVFDRPGCHARGMVFSPDGRFLVCSDADGLSLWEPGSWRLLRRAEGQVGTLRFTRDGRYLAGSLASQTSVVRLFDANTLEPLASLEPPETYPTYDLAFSSDDAWLAQIISRDGLVHLWDLRRIRATLAGMGLDWGLPPYPDAPVNPEPPSRIEIHSAAPAVQ